MLKQDLVHQIISFPYTQVLSEATAFAPVNIALAKYWGKKDLELHLPVTDSFSVTINAGTTTTVQKTTSHDTIFLNNEKIDPSSSFYTRLVAFLDLFRPSSDFFFDISTTNTIPTAAGLASSASGFAAIVLALNAFFGWTLSTQKLSILARLGSGSACRSVFSGFAHWVKGKKEDDSFAIPFNKWWDELAFGICLVSKEKKYIDSRQAMKETVETSSLYPYWPAQVNKNLSEIIQGIETKDFALFGQALEQNALVMHSTMLAATPAICYWKEKTLSTLRLIWNARKQGLLVFGSMDAGPNVKLFFLKKDLFSIKQIFPDLVHIELLGPKTLF